MTRVIIKHVTPVDIAGNPMSTEEILELARRCHADRPKVEDDGRWPNFLIDDQGRPVRLFNKAVDGTSYTSYEIADIARTIKGLVIIAELAIERFKRPEVTAPPKPKPEPEGDDDIPDAS